MARVVCVWLPMWPTDRLRRQSDAPLPAEPLITAARERARRVVTGVDHAAAELGLRAGMTVALAQAMIPGLHVTDADPAADAAALQRLARWALRYTPIVAVDPPDGLVLDVAGADHLHGGEAALVADLTDRLAAAGICARGALADTWAAAWGLARFARPGAISPQGHAFASLADLPTAALRLDAGIVTALRRLGFDTVGELAGAHRPSLALRFDPALTRRLDQARGIVAEPIVPFLEPSTPQARLSFADPLMHSGGLAIALRKLAARLCADLRTAGLGARQLDLHFHRTDDRIATLRIGASRPTRDPAHIVRLFGERLDAIDPGFGVETAALLATRTEVDTPAQLSASGTWDMGEPDIASLVDRIVTRIGADRIYRLAPAESDVPERSERQIGPLSPPLALTWDDGPRPSRWLRPPEPVEALAALPDRAPARFIWRGIARRVIRADGPRRVHGEWWRSPDERWLVRDYWRVEDEGGQRWWLYRTGDGEEPATGSMRWFLHGVFA